MFILSIRALALERAGQGGWRSLEASPSGLGSGATSWALHYRPCRRPIPLPQRLARDIWPAISRPARRPAPSARSSPEMSQSNAAPAQNRSNSFFGASLAESDPEIARAIALELGRQRDEIELIASENIVSKAVLEAQGSVMTNKYAEGYPGRRYYGGCEFVDIAETLAIERAKRLFDCRFANVQPHSGARPIRRCSWR